MKLKKTVDILDEELDEEHDYNPEWYYESITDVDAEFTDIAFEYKKEIEKELLPQLKMFKKIDVYFGKIPKKETLGIFVNGTSSEPVIVLDPEQIKNGMEKYKKDAETAVNTTIIHEIGHAIQEYTGKDENKKGAEQEAEKFGREWYKNKTIYKFWEQK